MGEGVNRESKVKDMLKRKFQQVRYGEEVDIEQYPSLKAEKKILAEELENKVEYRDRLKNIEQAEIKKEMQDKLSRASSQGDLDLIRKMYTKKLFNNSLSPESKEMQKVLTEIDILSEKLEKVESKLNYINAEYADQIERVEDERVQSIIKEANEIE
jgi:hypothetical protein